jgi:recombination protein RecA
MSAKEKVIEAMLKKGVNLSEQLVDPERYMTGLPAFDRVTGGIPSGLLTVFWGAANTGKSTVALLAAARVSQEHGVLWVDAEGSFSKEYAQSLGVNIGNLIVYQPSESAEVTLANILDMINMSSDGRILARGEDGDTFIKLVVIDSVNALASERDLNGDISDKDMGNIAKIVTKFQRIATGVLKERDAAMIMISQMRTQIGVMYGSPDTMSGGNALRHWASLIVKFSKSRVNKVKEVTSEMASEVPGLKDKIGMGVEVSREIRARVVKTRVRRTIPGHDAVIELRMFPKPSVDPIPQLLAVSASMGVVIDKNGNYPKGNSTFFFGETKLGAGFKKSVEAVRNNQDIMKQLYAEVYERIVEDG